VKAVRGHDETSVLRLAASLERGSEHPLAASIIAGAAERGVKVSTSEEFRSVTGMGVLGRVEGHAVALGNLALMQDLASRSMPCSLRQRRCAIGTDSYVRGG